MKHASDNKSREKHFIEEIETILKSVVIQRKYLLEF